MQTQWRTEQTTQQLVSARTATGSAGQWQRQRRTHSHASIMLICVLCAASCHRAVRWCAAWRDAWAWCCTRRLDACRESARPRDHRAQRAVIRINRHSHSIACTETGDPVDIDGEQFERNSQECVFKEIGTTILENAFAGFNCSLLAYGQTQTGSGKCSRRMWR